MKLAINLAAIFAAATLAVSVSAALAGVVVEEQEVVNRGGQPVSRSRTIMIEGNKQKIVSDRDIMVTDLDRGVMLLISPTGKTYSEMPFPPKGMSAPVAAMANVKFTKSGTHQTIDHYKCDNYAGVSHMMGTQSNITECFSKSAPGAAEFAAFQKQMVRKLQGTGAAAMVNNVPTGVPLASESTTSMKGLTIPGMPPDQAQKLSQMMASRPPITSKTTVTKISTRSIPDSEFAAPAGYTKQTPQTAPPAVSSSGRSGNPSAHSLPE
ncbi:MAG: DUF4412 domain-containing protein [Candidatus Binataceae bacterium]|nr:DUF4412 domain-containing protein [Candidatus Binataceae bacterium]